MPIHTQGGQATTETLVSLLFLVPLFVLLPYIGKYLDIKDKTIAGARYLVWERTVRSDPAASWGADENRAGDDEIIRAAGARILGDPRRPILTSAVPPAGSRNPLWRDYRGGELIALESFAGGPSTEPSARLKEQAAPVAHGPAVTALAFGELPSFGSVGGAFDLGLGLTAQSFAAGDTALSIAPLPAFDYDGAFVDIRPPTDDAPRIRMRNDAAVLTDAWIPGSEDNFSDRVDGLVTDEALQLIVLPGTLTFGNTLLFQEGSKGKDPELESETTVVPRKYVELFPEFNEIFNQF